MGGVYVGPMVIRTLRKNEKIKYQVKSFRLNEKTWENLVHRRKKFGKSWNLFMVELLKKNGKVSK